MAGTKVIRPSLYFALVEVYAGFGNKKKQLGSLADVIHPSIGRCVVGSRGFKVFLMGFMRNAAFLKEPYLALVHGKVPLSAGTFIGNLSDYEVLMLEPDVRLCLYNRLIGLPSGFDKSVIDPVANKKAFEIILKYNLS